MVFLAHLRLGMRLTSVWKSVRDETQAVAAQSTVRL